MDHNTYIYIHIAALKKGGDGSFSLSSVFPRQLQCSNHVVPGYIIAYVTELRSSLELHNSEGLDGFRFFF